MGDRSPLADAYAMLDNPAQAVRNPAGTNTLIRRLCGEMERLGVEYARALNSLSRENADLRNAIREHRDDFFYQVYADAGTADPEYALSQADERDLRLWRVIEPQEDNDA